MAVSPVVLFLAFLLCQISLVTSQFVFRQEPSNVSVTVGDPFTLTCEAVLVADPSAVLSYRWVKNGTLIGNTSTFTVESALRTDNGLYICTASLNGLVEQRSASVTIIENTAGLGADLVTVIVVSVVVGVIALVLLAVVLCIWLSLCLHKTHIWDSALHSQRSKVRTGRRKSLASQDHESFIEQSNKPQRSKSLGHLFAGRSSRKNSTTSFVDPYDRHLSHSTELLLSGEETGEEVHPPIEETLDHELHLDEHLFETDKKAKSENDLKTRARLAPLDRQIATIDDLSKQHRMKSDPYTIFKPTLSGATSQRTSVNSSYSDLGDDYSDGHSQTSSLFKSVRFDLNDSSLDSGVVTGSSSPYTSTEKRRSSAPDVNCVRDTSKRRGSAPDEYRETLQEEKAADSADRALPNKDTEHVKDGDCHSNQPEIECPEDNVASMVSVLSSVQSETSICEEESSHAHSRVSLMMQRFQTEVKGQEDVTPQFRTRSVSKLVNERTRQLLKTKSNKSTSDIEPRKLKGLIRQLSIPSNTQNGTKDPNMPSNMQDGMEDQDTSKPNNIQHGKKVSSMPSTTQESTKDPIMPSSTRKSTKLHDNSESTVSDAELKQSSTQQELNEDELMLKFEQERMSAFALPVFTCPVSMSPWQPSSNDDSDSDDDDDSAMVSPIKAQTGLTNISPFGKGLITNKLLSLPLKSPSSDMFVATGKNTPSRKNSVGRLTSIPEESPQGSSISLTRRS